MTEKLYFASNNLKDAVALLNRYPEESKILAGATDFIVKMNIPSKFFISSREIGGLA